MDVRRTAKRLLIGGALAGVIGLVGAMVTDSAEELSYQVMVAEPSATGRMPACKPTLIVVDQTTGKELPCAGSVDGGYTTAERQEIVRLSTSTAADGRLDTVDAFKLSELAAAIGRRHGDSSGSPLPWIFGTVAIIGGLSLLTGIALRVGASVRRTGPRR